jgi:predicted dehydrogenase
MVTKSMVYTMEEAERVVEAVDKSGLTLLVTQTMRGRFDFMDAKRMCDDGTIGDLFMAEAHYVHDLRPVYEQTPWRVQMPQDLVLGGACHPIDLLRWFMGDIAEVHCYGLRSGVSEDYPQEDTFVINVKFASGKIGRVANFLGVIHPSDVPMNSLTVYGTRGTILNGKATLDADEWLPQRDTSVEFPSQRGHSGEMIVMLQHMADCVLNGATPWVGAREGARVVSTCLSAWDSLRSGQPAEVRNEF